MAAEYDIVVIGAGNAGSVLAARLSERPDLNVLVLEAGADHNARADVSIPAGGRALWADASINWGLETVPQDQYAGRTIKHHRGKGLGGTTLVNMNCMTFSDKRSIDNFGAIGNPDWSYEKLEPYFRKFHTFHDPPPAMAQSLGVDYAVTGPRGTSGPVQISYGNHVNEFYEAWSLTWSNLGWKSAADPSTGDAIGQVIAPGTIDPTRFTRSHAGVAYLTPEVRRRPNLHIMTEALVERILFEEGSQKVVRGVHYRTKDGESKVVLAREVILCGGVFHSPQILELSGIGSSDVLAKHDIPLIVDSPGVGENLQDHALVPFSLESAIPTFDSFRDPSKLAAVTKQYQETRSGPFSQATYSQSYMPCMSIHSDSGKAEMKGILDQFAKSTSRGLQKQYDLVRSIVEDPKLSSVQYIFFPIKIGDDQILSPLSEEARNAQYFTLWASLSHPFSRGSSHIRSSSVADPPLIDPRYFSNHADVEIVARHLQYLDTVSTTKPLVDLRKPNGHTIPADLDLKSLEYTKKMVATGSTTYHPCGTCAMMPQEDGGVVDPRFKVHGVSGLRVVDASIFPLIPRGNLQSCVYAIAERAADFIKEDLA